MALSYESTRGGEKGVTSSQAILKGLAKDGGLFMPTEIPALDLPVRELAGLSYQETAYRIMRITEHEKFAVVFFYFIFQIFKVH